MIVESRVAGVTEFAIVGTLSRVWNRMMEERMFSLPNLAAFFAPTRLREVSPEPTVHRSCGRVVAPPNDSSDATYITASAS